MNPQDAQPQVPIEPQQPQVINPQLPAQPPVETIVAQDAATLSSASEFQPNVTMPEAPSPEPVQALPAAPAPAYQPTQPSVIAPETPAAPTPLQPPAQPIAAAQPVQPLPTQMQPPAMPLQPLATPQAPAYPVSANGAGLPPKNKKRLIIIGAIVAAVIVVVVAALFAFMSMSKISKEDYQKANTSVNDLTKKLSENTNDMVDVSYLSTYSTSTEANNKIDTAKKSLEGYKTANTSLKGLKAFRDSGIKAKNKIYQQKSDSYITYANNYLDSYKKISPALIAYNDANTSYSKSITEVKPLYVSAQKMFEEASSVSDKDTATLSKSMSTILSTYIQLIDERVSARDNDYTKIDSIRDRASDLDKQANAAMKDFTSNQNKHFDEVDPSKSARDLSDTVFNKYLSKSLRK